MVVEKLSIRDVKFKLAEAGTEIAFWAIVFSEEVDFVQDDGVFCEERPEQIFGVIINRV